MFYFYITWKRQKTSGFSRVLGVYRNVALTWNGLTVCSNRIRRSSRPDVFCRKDILRNFAKFTRKHFLPEFLFLIELQAPPALFLKKGLWHSCFSVNFAKFLRTPFLQNTADGCFWIPPDCSCFSDFTRIHHFGF